MKYCSVVDESTLFLGHDTSCRYIEFDGKLFLLKF